MLRLYYVLKLDIFTTIMNIHIHDEWFPVVDEEGNTISKALRSVCHNGKSRLLHPVVHMHLLNNEGELFLQKRAMTKDLLPGYWDTSVGGHISPGESVEEALKREALEELQLEKFTFQFLKKYIWESPRERELVYSFTGDSDNYPVINTNEIEEGKFWSVKDIEKNIGKNLFTPNFEHEFYLLYMNLI
jgi:isopentenyldiphosphate isomerase